jgi:hypothetical protein
MKVQLTHNLDVLGNFQVQNRHQQLKILIRGKKRVGLCYFLFVFI